jgi:hypothetical protein
MFTSFQNNSSLFLKVIISKQFIMSFIVTLTVKQNSQAYHILFFSKKKIVVKYYSTDHFIKRIGKLRQK